MNASRVLLVCVMVSAIYLEGCKGTDGPVGPGGPAGPVLTGDLGGFAFLEDSLGNVVKNDSGITVTIDSTTDSASTDSSGRWIIHGLRTGTYRITWSKAGYGTYKTTSYSFVGGNALTFYGNTYLYVVPNFIVSGVTADTVGGTVNIKANFVGPFPATYNFALAFFSTSPSVSMDPAKYKFETYSYTFNAAAVSITVSPSTFVSNGIASGTVVYIVLYAAGRNWNSYYDFNTNMYVFTSLNPTPSNVVSVTVP